ncbi:MAG TPA: multifunctional CCA tRNA nucleotidyl transferase/2'3'-cyclic phosphodiesterase/2'nucleotidase/phosphatase, partial [Gammaproteobacteria bacterium]|nr:multifunctional CCA tRNA nucleotidyl transferase/2'3'-cyclic phosphodiesterase/2'nucleotidase/phosphatase [Gammaproteobacteria bacterium]
FDIMRRPQRFADFIAASEMDSRGRLGFEDRFYPQADYLRGAADAVRAVSAAPLIEQGIQGAELGLALTEARQQALQRYVEQARTQL